MLASAGAGYIRTVIAPVTSGGLNNNRELNNNNSNCKHFSFTPNSLGHKKYISGPRIKMV